MHRVIILLLFVFGWSVTGWADVVVFKNGDQLTGKLVKLEEGKLTFEADVLGNVTLDITRIRNFTTDESVALHFADGTIIKSRLLEAAPDKIHTEQTKLLAGQTFIISDLVAINPSAKPKPKWAGSITINLSSTHGNNFSESVNVSFDVTRRSEIDRTNLYAGYTGSSSKDANNNKKTTEENFRFGGKYDYFFNEKFYSYVSGNYEKDHIADLDYRVIGGIGCGYQWVETDDISFATDAGFAQLNERYTTGAITTRSEEGSLRLGYDLKWKFAEKFTFFHTMNYYPSLGSFSDYFLTTDAEIRAAITESMFSSLKAVLDYNATPADGVGTTDVKYILGVGWNF